MVLGFWVYGFVVIFGRPGAIGRRLFRGQGLGFRV